MITRATPRRTTPVVMIGEFNAPRLALTWAARVQGEVRTALAFLWTQAKHIAAAANTQVRVVAKPALRLVERAAPRRNHSE
jgi:hypothetical protein